MSGNDQKSRVAFYLPDPIVVQVKDASGRPVPNHVVKFEVTSGGGRVDVGLANTNAEGIANERWWIGGSTAGEQRLQVIVVSTGTGAPTFRQEIRATAVPADVARLAIAGDTVRVMALGDTNSVVITGAWDGYQNPIHVDSVPLTLASSNAAVVAVAGRTIRAVSGGESVVTLTSGTTTLLRVNVWVEATTQLVAATSSTVNVVNAIYDLDGRMTAVAEHIPSSSRTYQWTGSAWDVRAIHPFSPMTAISSPNGGAWMSGRPPCDFSCTSSVWRGTSPDTWTEYPLPAGVQPGSPSEAPDGTLVIATPRNESAGSTGKVYRLNGNAWTSLAAPTHLDGQALRGGFAMARSASKVYYMAYGQIPAVHVWDGLQWSVIRADMPAGTIPRIFVAEQRPGAGRLYVYINTFATGANHHSLFEVDEAAQRLVPMSIPEMGSRVLYGIAVQPNGEPVLHVWAGGLDVGELWRRTTEGAWQRIRFTGKWESRPPVAVGRDGAIWVPVFRNEPSQTIHGIMRITSTP